ncbi:MAG: hypothetical protein VKJ06_00715 [Vampirovibrionales bacterium]|nr:hypothetical protein [Vampirovibrionales bacterium]
MTNIPSFWTWFFKGYSGRAGILKFFDRWLCVHLMVGLACSVLIKKEIAEVASTFLLPLASIFVGLCFAWAGNAQALLQTREIENFANQHADGILNYVYTFQSAILIILVTLVLWGLAAINLFDFKCIDVYLWQNPSWGYFFQPENSFFLEFLTGRFIKVILYAMASLTLRECWHIVLGSHMLLLIRAKISSQNTQTP